MSFIRNVLSVGSATLLSRVLGFVRDSLIAAALGTGPVADAFLVAFRLPNLFRRLFSEGAFNAAFVPLYARSLREEGDAAARGFAGEVLSLLVLTSGILTVAAMVFAPWLVLFLAPGFRDDPQKFESAVTMARVCLPYLACLTLAGLFAGLLAARRRFLAAALAPVALNVVTIVALAILLVRGYAHTWLAGLVLSGAILLSGVVQLLIMVVATARARALPAPRRPRFGPDIRRLMRLGAPGLVAAGIAQINITVGTIIASLDPGAVSVLYYADRVYQLPLGVVGIAIGMVLLPEMVHALQLRRDDLAVDAQNRSLEFAAILTVPAAAALVVLAQPIIEVLFERGAFGPHDTTRTAAALAAFAVGLPAFVAIRVLTPAFFAREDTRTPMLIGGLGVAVNIALSLVFFDPWREIAIALATSVSGWISLGGLVLVLVRRGHWRLDLQLERAGRAVLAATAAMVAVLWVLREALSPLTGAENNTAVKIAALGLVIAAGLGTYFGTGQMFGLVDLAGLKARLRRKSAAPDEVPALDP